MTPMPSKLFGSVVEAANKAVSPQRRQTRKKLKGAYADPGIHQMKTPRGKKMDRAMEKPAKRPRARKHGKV